MGSAPRSTLADHAEQLLPYRGLGSGIPRALGAWSKVEFDDDERGNQFRVVVARPAYSPDFCLHACWAPFTVGEV